MMDAVTLSCRIADRRKKLFDNPRWNGIDFVEVLPRADGAVRAFLR